VALRAAGVAGTIGAWSVADRLRMAVEPVAPIDLEIPSHLPAHRRVFRMFRCGDRDQVVVKLASGWDNFEMPMPDALTVLAHNLGGTILDVGANTGIYSILATMAHPTCEAVAFEPFPPVVEVLRRNLASNRLGRRVRVVAQAVSAAAGTAELFVPDPGHGLIETSCSLNELFKDTHAGSVSVRVTTVDAYMRAHARLRPTIVKIDVESLEDAVLEGARQTLATHRPLVFFEVLHIGDPDAIERLRVELDYVDVRLDPGGLVAGEAVRHDPGAWNHLLVPAEKLAAALTLLGTVGLQKAQ